MSSAAEWNGMDGEGSCCWLDGGRGGGGGGLMYVCVCMYGLQYVRFMGVCVCLCCVCMVLGSGLGRYSDTIPYNTIRKPNQNQTKSRLG